MGVVAAERIKLTSTRSPWWCSIVIVVLGLAIGTIMAGLSHNTEVTSDPNNPFILTPDTAVSGVSGFGVMVVMIMAALAVTTEYRFGVIHTSFQAVPHRSRVLLAKAALVAGVAAVVVAVATFGSYYLAKVIAGTGPAVHLELDADGWRGIYGVVIYAVLAAVLAVGVGALIRQSAAAIAVLVLWSLIIEQLFLLFGSVGKDIYVWLPFANINHFMGTVANTGSPDVSGFHWGPWGGLAYFAVVTAIVFGASLIVVGKRDA